MVNQQGKTERIAWLAGFLDGEGSFIMLRHTRGQNGHQYSKQWKPTIKISNTHVPTLNYMTELLDEMELPYHVSWRHPQNKKWATSWMIEVAGLKRCLRWTMALLEYLHTKREDCELMLEYCHTRLQQKPSWNLKDSVQGAKPQLTERQLEIISHLRGRGNGVYLKRSD